jgi:tripeptide aminopeptidase
MTDAFLKLFVNHRNLVPVVSVEGHAQSTDARRGEGTFKQLDQTMNRLKNAGLLFGASITVTRENMDEVLSDTFVEELVEKGCRAVLYIEYVPVDEISMQLAPTPKDNVEIEKRVRRLRETFDKLLFISFPGDEHKSGGCLAAGRGFFHINPKGGAEPCPASPYSDSDIRKLGVRGALKSPLFRILREGKILMENHAGGCVLFENRQNMDTLIRKSYIQKERMVEEFMELTSIDSVSFKERKMADALKKKLADLGVEVYEDDAGKDCGGNAGNVYGYLKGTLPGAPLLFSAHMDTVEPGIGKKPVYQPDGKITSQGDTVLGADDVAGIEAILEAIRCIQEHQIPHRDIEVVFPVAEEVYGLGSVRFDYQKLQAKEAYVLDLSGEIGTASLQEPTLISFCIKIHGKASHSGFAPELGVHAIAIAAEAIEKIKQGRVDEETTVNIGMISGGAATNIVPELVTLKGEVRSYCHEKALVQLQRIGVIFTGVAASRGATCEIEYTIHLKAYQVPEETPVVQRFLHVCDRLGIEGNLTKTFGGSDNNIFLQHGISGIVLACGMHQVHTLQEYTHQDDLTNCAAIVLELMTGEEEIQ